MSSSSTYIITGSARGMGLAFVKAFVARPNSTVYAGVRSLSSAGELNELAKTHSNLHIVQLVSGSTENVAALASKLGKVDGELVVIANAGIYNKYQTADVADVSALREHFEINTIGPIVLFQGLNATLKGAATAKFIGVSTRAGSITATTSFRVPCLSYGVSKAAFNYALAKIAQENPKLIVLPLNPGLVKTDMGNDAAAAFGIGAAPLTIDQSVGGMVKVIDEATLEQSGKFTNFDGASVPW